MRDLLPEPVMAAGRAAIRGYGMATARARPGPDFLLIGGKRAGSTSLYYALLEHPRIIPLFPSGRLLFKANHTKGVHFFDTNFGRGPRWYHSHFPTTLARRRAAHRSAGPVLTGEGSPYYLFHPLAAERAALHAPAARILLILRDPVERTFSHYRERLRSNAEPLSFEEALDAEASRIAGQEERIRADPAYRSYAHEHQSYVAQSEYARGLRRWLERFGRERICVMASEDFYAEPERVCAEIVEFLGLPPAPLRSAAKVWNPAPSQQMSQQTRRRLAEHFAPHNAELEELLGRRFPRWTGDARRQGSIP